MPRPNPSQLQFDALSLEGALLPPEWLAKVAALEATAQAPADYGVPRGLQLRDEIGRYWRIAEAVWADFVAARVAGDAEGATRHLIRDLLVQVFGFTDLAPLGECAAGGRTFHLAFSGIGGRVPVVVGPWTEELDQNLPRHGDGVRRRSAWGAVQEYLNSADDALWGIATNGLSLRLARDNASLTRPAWLEADLSRIFAEQRYADFSVLWLLIHASRFGRPDGAPSEAPLERWREAGREQGTRARDTLRNGVEEALLALGQGFLSHKSNGALREALATRALLPADYFTELLRLVYRLIFLLTVEERDILHPPGATAGAVRLYGIGYGMRRLRDRALRHSAHDRHSDLWASLSPVFRSLGNPDGEPMLGLPGLGGLFAPTQCPHLDACALENRGLLTAIYRLAWLKEAGALARVNWRDMGVEELGSVYESLLELVPLVSDGGRAFSFASVDEAAGNTRKLTGSYYTPDALVQQLLDTALEPVIEARLAAADPGQAGAAERALLGISVVDPACGSGHFLLAAARRIAGHLARAREGGTPAAPAYRTALRDVVSSCIYGVDRNPMALELARMALWLEAYTPDRALGFIDHHLVCGDALLGLLDLSVVQNGIPDEAFKALTGDDKAVVKTLAKLNRQGRKALEERKTSNQVAFDLGTLELGAAFSALDAEGDSAIADVEVKRAHYTALAAQAAESRAALAADCFVGAFLVPKRLSTGELTITDMGAAARYPTSGTLHLVLEGALRPEHGAAQAAQSVCRGARVLHWPLAFPQIFARGGFEVVLGNPPWERLKLQEEEFFAVRAPAVAEARNKAERERQIAKLGRAAPGTPERVLYDEFMGAKQLAEGASNFCHSGARYPLTGVGDVNTYALFAETMYRLVNRGGRLGVVLPTGIATDDSTKLYFDEVVASRSLVRLAAYENEERIFLAVHHAFKFCLLTVAGAPTHGPAELSFFARQAAQVHDRRRRFSLSAEEFQLLNPNTRTCPIFRSAADAELTKKIHRKVPVLLNEATGESTGNSWGVSFMRMFDMANDSGLFLAGVAGNAVPLYEAKFIGQFDHRRGSYESRGAERGFRVLPEATLEQYQDQSYGITPSYWIDAGLVRDRVEAVWRREWFLGFKDVTAVGNERTVISSILPFCGVAHKLPLVIFPPVIGADLVAAFLCGLNSLVFDYVARQKVGGLSLSYFILKQLPVPSPASLRPHLAWIVPRALELTYTACDLRDWARDLGHDGPPFTWDPDRRAVLRAELDAYYGNLYGLTREDLRYVLDPADVMGSDYPSETFRVLKQSEEREYGEYRTRRLVLEAWDRLFGS